MTKLIVSRVPDFVGHDGRVYNAVYGTFISKVNGMLNIGSKRRVNLFMDHSTILLEADEFPAAAALNFTPYYNGDPSQYVRLYNADA